MSTHQAGRTCRRLPVAFSALLLLGLPSRVHAGATLTVTDCGDAGAPGQLRTLMNAAAGGDTIVVPVCTILLQGKVVENANAAGDLDFTKDLTVLGQGDTTVISGNDIKPYDGVVHVLPGVTVTMSHLVLRDAQVPTDGGVVRNDGTLTLNSVTVRDGTSWSGAGIINTATANLTLNDCTLTANTAYEGSGGGLFNEGTATLSRTSVVQNYASSGGGGIDNRGTLVMSQSTISGNDGQVGVGGGLTNRTPISGTPPTATIIGSTISGNTVQLSGGGIHNQGTLTVVNATISGNNASTGTGGGLKDAYGSNGAATATLSWVTLAGNTAPFGSNIQADFGTGTLSLEGTIVSGGGCFQQPPTSLGHNLDEGNTCGFTGPGDLVNVGDAGLDVLAGNGGSTPTRGLRDDSPAIDAGGAGCPATDQIGVVRPQGAACDIGAVEWTSAIFQDGFESGDMSAWSSSATGGGDLTVTGGAALGGTTQGLQAVVNDGAGLYVEDDSPSAETRYRARFYFAPNGFDPGEAQSHFRARVFIMFDDAGTRRLSAIVLKRQGGSYSIMQRCRRDDDSQQDSGFFPISDAPHWVLAEWRRATGAGSADGSCALTVDGTVLRTMSDVPNNVSTLGNVRLGTMNVKAGASGTPFFDEFVSRRIGAIPPLP